MITTQTITLPTFEEVIEGEELCCSFCKQEAVYLIKSKICKPRCKYYEYLQCEMHFSAFKTGLKWLIPNIIICQECKGAPRYITCLGDIVDVQPIK